MTELRPIGTIFEDVIETPEARVVVKRRVVGHRYPGTDGEQEITQEVSRESQPKATGRPSETK